VHHSKWELDHHPSPTQTTHSRSRSLSCAHRSTTPHSIAHHTTPHHGNEQEEHGGPQAPGTRSTCKRWCERLERGHATPVPRVSWLVSTRLPAAVGMKMWTTHRRLQQRQRSLRWHFEWLPRANATTLREFSELGHGSVRHSATAECSQAQAQARTQARARHHTTTQRAVHWLLGFETPSSGTHTGRARTSWVTAQTPMRHHDRTHTSAAPTTAQTKHQRKGGRPHLSSGA